jgi:hypothetical protein
MAQQQKRRRSAYPALPTSTSSWDATEVESSRAAQRHAGTSLLKHLLGLYAVCKLNAKDFTIACHYAALAHVPGGDFALYALSPDQSSSGNYQKHLDKVLPGSGPLYYVDVPCTIRGRGGQQLQSLPMMPMHEAFAKEIKVSPELLDIKNGDWAPCYESNPIVVQAQRDGLMKPIPIALYLDAVRFTAQSAGRTDSMLGFWAHSLQSNQRHLLTCIRTRDFCRCGCRGWCSVYPILLSLSWSAHAMVSGQRPLLKHDGSCFDAGDEFGNIAIEHGSSLNYRAVILYIKGDWAEVAHSLGLAGVTSKHCPCQFCYASKENLHTRYRSVSPLHWPWDSRPENGYELECRGRELQITIRTEIERQLVLQHLHFVKKRGHGRTIVSQFAVSGRELLPGDRLEPSANMLFCSSIDHTAVPFIITFWRPRIDSRGACMDSVVHRNPLFSESLGTSPVRTLAIDTLHTVYYGPVMRWTSAVLWRIILGNQWGFVGSPEYKLELACRRLRCSMMDWFEVHNIAHERRIGDFTLKMVGPAGKYNFENIAHGGGILKTKAAETGIMMEWALDELLKHDAVPFRDDLVVAGEAMKEWLTIIRSKPVRLDPASHQQLMDCMVRALVHCEQGRVHDVPKFHMFAHASQRAYTHGNPRFYSTFVDESLNLLLRTIAAFAHRAHQVARCITMLNLQGALGISAFIFGAASD